jgi:putative oxidoreductase
MKVAVAMKRSPEQGSQSGMVFAWALRLTAAAILLQTLFFKFTGAPESVYIFTRVHAEPWGRIGSGVMELIASALLLWPRFTWAGALLAAGMMVGAISSHMTLLGIDVQGDRGLLFGLALTVFASSVVLLFVFRKDVPVIGERFS